MTGSQGFVINLLLHLQKWTCEYNYNIKGGKKQDMNETKNENYLKKFGQYVREHREKKNYTQSKLAELLNVTPKTISYIERG